MIVNQNQLYIIRHITTGDCFGGTNCRTIRLYRWKDARRIVNQHTRRQNRWYNPDTRRHEMRNPPIPSYYEIVPIRLEVGPPIG